MVIVPAAIVGAGFTVTVVPAEVGEVQPEVVSVTVYIPLVVTVMEAVVAPVDHVLPDAAEEVSTTFPPPQNVVGPPAVIVGVGGRGLTDTVVPAEAGEVQPPEVAVTV